MTTPAEPAAAATMSSETNAAPAAAESAPAAPVTTAPAEVAPATPQPVEVKPAAPAPVAKPAPPAETAQPAPVIVTAAGVVQPKVKPGVMSATNQIGAIYTGRELGLKPLESPPLPITATQEAQLQALLAKYKANQITPDEYQRQRAEILAQP
jgi:hypothetical protein